MTTAEQDLVRRLRQQRREHWGLDLPDPAPVVARSSWLRLVPYVIAALAVLAIGIRW
jgi:hypothetical protein